MENEGLTELGGDSGEGEEGEEGEEGSEGGLVIFSKGEFARFAQ
jgi:hypothetical protein